MHLQEGAFLAADDMMFVGWCQFWLRFEATQQRLKRQNICTRRVKKGR